MSSFVRSRAARVGLWGSAMALVLVACSSSSDDIDDGDTCFVGRTKVMTPDGERSLEDLRVGDEILACDPHTGVVAVRKVVALIVHGEKPTLTLDAGDLHVVGVTDEHPFWVASRGEHGAWVEAGNLRAGDLLRVLEPGASAATLRRLETVRVTGRSEKVFDLSVEGPEHTFFADGVLVHNKSTACPEDPINWCWPPTDAASADAHDAHDAHDVHEGDATPDASADADADADADAEDADADSS